MNDKMKTTHNEQIRLQWMSELDALFLTLIQKSMNIQNTTIMEFLR